jgi:hypothetical protein
LLLACVDKLVFENRKHSHLNSGTTPFESLEVGAQKWPKKVYLTLLKRGLPTWWSIAKRK